MHSVLRLRAAAARPLALRRCFSQSYANLSGHNKVNTCVICCFLDVQAKDF